MQNNDREILMMRLWFVKFIKFFLIKPLRHTVYTYVYIHVLYKSVTSKTTHVLREAFVVCVFTCTLVFVHVQIVKLLAYSIRMWQCLWNSNGLWQISLDTSHYIGTGLLVLFYPCNMLCYSDQNFNLLCSILCTLRISESLW